MIRNKDDPYLWTFNIKVTKLPVMNVSFRLNSFLNRFFVNNFKANQCWNSHPKRSIFYFLLLLSPYGCGWPCWDLYTKWSLLPHFLCSCKRKCISVEEGGGNAISCIIFGVFFIRIKINMLPVRIYNTLPSFLRRTGVCHNIRRSLRNRVKAKIWIFKLEDGEWSSAELVSLAKEKPMCVFCDCCLF